jgi:Raf kinase inhibitor-like YbhB/YbcL family protein
MKLHSKSLLDGAPINARFAAGRLEEGAGVNFSDNISPHLRWGDAPTGTKSFAVICCDPDVPSRGDDVNQTDREVPASLPRVDFFHWVLVDLAASIHELEEGAFSRGFTPRGKPGPMAPLGARQGLNDYTGWFAADAQNGGNYFGYDGPFPPFNDAIVHRYVFTVYALDVARLGVEGHFTGAQARAAMEGHVLATASLTGLYTLNARLR